MFSKSLISSGQHKCAAGLGLPEGVRASRVLQLQPPKDGRGGNPESPSPQDQDQVQRGLQERPL